MNPKSVIVFVYVLLFCILFVESKADIGQFYFAPINPNVELRTFHFSGALAYLSQVAHYSPGICYTIYDYMTNYKSIRLDESSVSGIDFFSNEACADTPSITYDRVDINYKYEGSTYKSFKACGSVEPEYFPVLTLNFSKTNNMKQSFFLKKGEGEGIKLEYEHGTCNDLFKNSTHFTQITLDDKTKTRCVEFYRNVFCIGNEDAIYTNNSKIFTTVDLTLYRSFKSCKFIEESHPETPIEFMNIFDSLSDRVISQHLQGRSLRHNSEFEFWALFIFYTRGINGVCNGLIPLYNTAPTGFISWEFLLPTFYRGIRIGEGYEIALNIVINTISDFELSPSSSSFYIRLYELALDVVQHRTTQMNPYSPFHQHVCTNSNRDCGSYLRHELILSLWTVISDIMYRLRYRLNRRDDLVTSDYVVKEFEKIKTLNLCNKNLHYDSKTSLN
ncbi:uncharacterized protein LOC114131532 isoform X1 [Aphis gossypii]|uniref:uncharacterized protein LOC114131532 isoform X1 n=1 Tax=Aphis gossypii TaxID=80765 RepID=UPI00215955EA|nr:uncharacterized protein LOC114131532 isoform X1 [Aphis gossypii]